MMLGGFFTCFSHSLKIRYVINGYQRIAARLSDHLVLNGLRISVQDLVFCESSVGFVTACCSEGDDLFGMMKELLFVKRVSAHSEAWRPPGQDGQLKVWPAKTLELAVAWYVERDNWIVIRI